MGLFSDIKHTVAAHKEKKETKNKMVARANNRAAFYGIISADPGDDFTDGSLVNLENGRGVIYSLGCKDYVFDSDSVCSITAEGAGSPIMVGSIRMPSTRCRVEFTDGKSAAVDIIVKKLSFFKAAFNIS